MRKGFPKKEEIDTALGELLGQVRAKVQTFQRKHETELKRAKDLSEVFMRRAERVGKQVEKHFVRGAKRGWKVVLQGLNRAEQGIQLADKEISNMERRFGVPKEHIYWGIALPFILVAVLIFARVFPPLTAFFSGPRLYTSARFSYEVDTVFDRSILTWGTDYILAVVMGTFTVLIAITPRTKSNGWLMLFSCLLIGSYSLSTLAGAFAHQFLGAYLNTAVFRFVWRICVGCVAAAGGFMGAAASEIARLPFPEPHEQVSQDDAEQDEDQGEKARLAGSESGSETEQNAEEDEVDKTAFRKKFLNFPVPIVPTFCWVAFSIFFLMANTVGFFSMKRPACDIFLVGVTQTPPTLYLVLVLYSRTSWSNMNVGRRARRIFLFGALANILLLPGYDLFNFLKMPVGVVNLILHTTLLVSWGSQAYGLLKFVKGVSLTERAKEKQT